MVARVDMVEESEAASGTLASMVLNVAENHGRIRVYRSEKGKCPRCWIYRMEGEQWACAACIDVLDHDGHLKLSNDAIN